MVRFAMPSFAGPAAVLVLAVPGSAYAEPCPCAKARVFVDCSATAPGSGTEDSPYHELAQVNGLKLGPGSTIRFKRGVTCEGGLTVRSSGTHDAPVVIGAYGPGAARPVLDAAGAEQAVLLDGVQNVQVSDLELTAPGNGATPRRGVYVHALDAGPLPGIRLTGLDIHDVRGEAAAKPADASGGIVVDAGGATTPTFFTGLTVEGVRVHAVDREGIALWSNWCRRPDAAPNWNPPCTEAWAPARDPLIRGNLLWDVGGDGIAVSAAQGAVIDANTVEGFGRRGSGDGIVTSGSAHASVTGNEISAGHADPADPTGGVAVAIGRASDHADVRANLSHGNGGGFALLAAAKDAPISVFSVRGNISVDDRAAGFSIGAGPITKGRIYGNTLYLARDAAQEIVNTSGSDSPDIRFRDNLITRGPAPAGAKGTIGWNVTGPPFALDHNLLHDVPLPSGDEATVTADPFLVAPGTADPYAYQLLAGSPALGAGRPLKTLRGFPVTATGLPSGAANLGAAQAPAAFPAALSAAFDTTGVGQPPAGWSQPSAGVVTADPSGAPGRSLELTGVGAVTHAFPVTGGELRVDARLWYPAAGRTLTLQVLDGKGHQVAAAGFDATGRLAHADGTATTPTAFQAPAGAWVRVSLLLHPATGTFDVTAAATPLGTGHLAPGAGLPAAVSVASTGSTTDKPPAVDDILVLPLPCAEPVPTSR